MADTDTNPADDQQPDNTPFDTAADDALLLDAPINADLMGEYEHKATPISRKVPPPGAYILRFPPQLDPKVVTTSFGKTTVEVNLGGTVIAEGEYAGEPLAKFLRVNTLPRKQGQKFHDVGDLLSLFGIDCAAFTRASEYIDALKSLENAVTPSPVYVTYNGSYRSAATNKRVYLKARDFEAIGDDGQKTWQKVLYLVDGKPQKALPTGVTNGRDVAREQKVFANFEVGYRGFVPRDAQ